MDQVDRRDFLKGSVCAVAAATATMTAVAENSKTEIDNRSKRISTGKLIVSAPLLMNAAETSVGVTFKIFDRWFSENFYFVKIPCQTALYLREVQFYLD